MAFWWNLLELHTKIRKKSCLDISKTHLWLKFHDISMIFVAGSRVQRKMYAFLSQILTFFWNILANFQKFKNPKKSPLDISKTHLWLKFHEILTIFVTASGPERKMYAFLKKFWAIFWPILGKTRIPAKALKLVWDSWKLPSMRSLGELGTILLRFFHFLEVPPIQNVNSFYTCFQP